MRTRLFPILPIVLVCAVSCSAASHPNIQTSTPVIRATNSATLTAAETRSATMPATRFNPLATPTPLPVVTLTPPPDKDKPNKENALLNMVMKSFVEQALRQRMTRSKSDPAYGIRVDKELDEGRVNFLVFGYGETFEYPAAQGTLIGSYTIVSYNVNTGKADLISLTHDVRAPEIERELLKQGKGKTRMRIDQAYEAGGFNLMREVVENATGFSIDFEIAFRDAIIPTLVDDVFGAVEIDVPAEFDLAPFLLDGKKYDEVHLAQGKQWMKGAQVIQFMKSIQALQHSNSLERNVRKILVFQALLDTMSKNCSDRGFWVRSSTFVARESANGNITYDFDPIALLMSRLGDIISGAGGFVTTGASCGIGSATIGKTIYIVDPSVGDGGVHWSNPPGMEEPFNANADGDLVTEYWPSVRSLIKTSLVSK